MGPVVAGSKKFTAVTVTDISSNKLTDTATDVGMAIVTLALFGSIHSQLCSVDLKLPACSESN
jgi:hypothetical protein